jgi:hypothetical protein
VPCLFTNRFYSYRYWYDKQVLEKKAHVLNPNLFEIPNQFRAPAVNPDESDIFQGYWVEYYNHKELTSLDSLFTFNMNGTLKYRPLKISSNSRQPKE